MTSLHSDSNGNNCSHDQRSFGFCFEEEEEEDEAEVVDVLEVGAWAGEDAEDLPSLGWAYLWMMKGEIGQIHDDIININICKTCQHKYEGRSVGGRQPRQGGGGLVLIGV